MSALELLRLALSRLRRAACGRALTMLGVIIGVASVVALVGVGQGTTANITSSLRASGTNLLTVSPTGGGGSPGTLTLDDADGDRAALGRRRRGRARAPRARSSRRRRRTRRPSIIGTTAAYATVRAYDVWQGAFLNDAASTRASGSRSSARPRPTTSGLDASASARTITIGGLPFRVIGILQPKGGTGFRNQDDQILVPIGVVQQVLRRRRHGAHHRRQRRHGRPDEPAKTEITALLASATTSARRTPTTSRSPTRPSS